MMPMPAITIKNRGSTERRQQGEKIKLPALLTELLHHPLSDNVIFDQKASRFLYAHHGTNGTAKSAVGLTTLIKKCFWPDYDPWDPTILNKVRVKNRAIKKLKQQSSTLNAANNIKRVVCRTGTNWNAKTAQGPYFIRDTQEFKTTWHPIGG